ncbi:MAG: RNA polymerase sigma factor [Clostridia bacterium]|nr:RNA polymerase sigma factor [Clostridia bacterium]
MNKIALEELYMQQLPGLFRLAQSILRQPADAEDAVQQAVLQAWQQIDTIRDGKEKAYLARIVINECHNIQRLRQRTVPVAVFPERTEPETKIMELRDAVDRLPEKLRLPFLLVYMEGYSLQEAASVIGITLFALKSRLKRAKKSLRIELREEGES